MNLNTVPRIRRSRPIRPAFSLSPFVRGFGQNPLDDLSDQLDPGGEIASSDVGEMGSQIITGDVTGSGSTGGSPTTITPAGSSNQTQGGGWWSNLGSTFTTILGGVVRAETPAIVGAITGQPNTPGGAITGGGLPQGTGAAGAAASRTNLTPFIIGGGLLLALLMFSKK